MNRKEVIMLEEIYNVTYGADSTWIVVSAVLALIGGILVFAAFVSERSEKYRGFALWLHKFLNFKKLFIDVVLKVMYVVSALFITLSSFSFIRVSVATAFLWLIFGNIVVRMVFEFISMLMTLVSNTTEINEKMNVNTNSKRRRNDNE